MNSTNNTAFDDETLMAYVDGELDSTRSAEVRGACALDPTLAQRIADFEHSRSALSGAFSQVLREPVPAHLVNMINAAMPAAEKPGVAAQLLGWLREMTQPLPMATAALAALATLLGVQLFHTPHQAGPAPLSVALQHALSTVPSGEPRMLGDDEFLPLATVKTAKGELCRQYELHDSAGTASHAQQGVACLDGQAWANVALIQEDKVRAGSGYVPASDGHVDLEATLGAFRYLDADAEAQLIAGKWAP